MNLNSAIQCMKYKEVLAADTALAKKNITNMDPVTGAVVPPNLVPGKPITMGMDNTNIRTESSTAENTGYDAVQHVNYQEGPGTANMRIETKDFCFETLKIPACMTQPIEVTVPIVKIPPENNTNLEIYKASSEIEKKLVPQIWLSF